MRGARARRGAGLALALLALGLALVAHAQDPGQEAADTSTSPSPAPTPSPGPAPSYTCDRIDRVPRAERCAFVREQCESDSRLPYTEWYYCSVAPHGAFASFMFTLFLAALLPLLFTLLGDTAEIYFSPIMTHVAQCIPKMRPRFAGVTFVAIGNGAPDLSSNISAIRNGDWLLSTGALTGAAMFVQCVVASEVMRASRGPVKCRGATLRDVAIYSASVLLVLASFAAGRITHWFIAGACVLYLTYALWVFAGDEWHERGRPHARTLWRSLRDTWDRWFGARQEPQGLPWAAVDVGGTLSPRASGTELLSPLVSAGRSGSLGGAVAGAGASGRPTSAEQRVRSPKPHQTHHHHLMSAKAYQTMVWADLSPEDPSGSRSARRLAAAAGGGGGGAGGGEADEEQGLLGRRRGGRKQRRRRHGGGGGGDKAAGAGRGPAGSALELGPASGYAPPALAPSSPSASTMTAPPSATAAAAAPRLGSTGGGSGLLTLSSLDGSALAAPAPVDAAPHWGSAVSLTGASSAGGAGPGATTVGDGGGVARKASLAPSSGSGRPAGAGSASLDPWASGGLAAAALGQRRGGAAAGSVDGSCVGSEVEDDEEEEGADIYDREAAAAAAREARRRRSRQGDEEDFEGGLASGSEGEGDGGSSSGGSLSSREAGPPRELWARVQYELTVGNSAEWHALPPDSLRQRWRAFTFPLLLPVYLALRLTIPFADPATYSRRWLLATCAAAPLLAALYLAPSAAAALPMVVVAAVVGAALAAAVGYFTAGEEDALPDWDLLGRGFAFGPAAFAVFGFFMGVIWIDTLASEAVGVVGLLAGLLRVPASVMGLTLMAWGNSLGDFFGNPAMARRGQPTMALTACFAGPLFNMLASLALGFGSYFARRRVGSAEVVLRPEVALGCAFLLLYNAAVAAAGLLNGGKLPERFYVFARAWYGLYFAAACVLGLWAGQGDA
ncbi:hypothetical protein HYH02_007714 [Chlamydomonas schloesseri]|uniref:Sodium/calcium exchanger membrane region domain-containing protein n=1 Tax=Chlamydomonas schloesseri TaxID=2026947 RepID=A0A835WH93_9CHLO|nr:hypothetical protein HYH02_007714 [Chlamydomonas schloesseri]|eukprot:KAG2447386.1 hypothetical protein HYH02_007714 [Chlamydomonas schloesseri]